MNKNVPIKYFVLGLLSIIIIFAGGLYLIPSTLQPVLIALLLAYAFDPVIDYFEKKGASRKKVVFWFLILVIALVIIMITVLIPYLVIQLGDLIENLPKYVMKALNWISTKIPLGTNTIKDKILAVVEKQYNTENFTNLAKFIKISFSSTAKWFISLAGALIIPVFFYFFLLDIDRLKSGIFKMIPKPYQQFIKVRLMKFDEVLSGFIRGQLTVVMILSLLYSIGLLIVGIPYGFLIGIIAGILNIVPYLGVSLGILASLLMAFIGDNVILQIIGVASVFLIVQTIEGFILTPNIVGEKVGLNPLATIIVILIGGELFGMVGMLAAVPLGGIIRIIFRDLKASYLKSNFYKRLDV